MDDEENFQQKIVMEIGGIKRDNTIINKGRQTGHENLLQIIS
jgi:hypothetical protein